MYIISLVMDKTVYVLGTEEMDLHFFDSTDSFLSFLNDAAKEGAFDLDAPQGLPLSATIIAGVPKAHDDNLETLMDVIEEETDVVLVMEKGSRAPFISFIACTGSKADEWRARGEDILLPKETRTTETVFRSASDLSFEVQEDKTRIH